MSRRKNPYISRSLVSLILALQDYRCVYCDRHLSMREKTDRDHMPTVDHATPLSMGGEPLGDNVVIACWTCNHDKGPLDAETFRSLRLDQQACKRAVAAACHAATARAKTKPPEDRAAYLRFAAISRLRLHKRITTLIDERRGDLSIREWFIARSVEAQSSDSIQEWFASRNHINNLLSSGRELR
jgi:hypothetical protein